MFDTLLADKKAPWAARAVLALLLVVGSAGAGAYYTVRTPARAPADELTPAQIRHVQEVARQEVSLETGENRRLLEEHGKLLLEIAERLAHIEGRISPLHVHP